MRERSRTVVYLLVLLAAALAELLMPVPPALAHTELVGWEFVGGTTDKPQELLLRFSEPIDSQFLTVDVSSQGGTAPVHSTVRVDPQRRTDGLVDISGLAPATYSVVWWTRAVDGDPSNGSFFMGLGTNVNPTALLPPVDARDPAMQPAMFYAETIWDTILHWLTYLGAALAIGSVGFALVIWSPAFRKMADQPRSSETTKRMNAHLLRTFRRLAIAGSLVFLFANLLLFLMQVEFIRYSLLQPVTSVSPTPLEPSALSHEPPYRSAADIFQGYNGRIWIARMVLAVVTLVLSFRLSPPAGRSAWRWTSTLLVASAALATVSLTAHAAVVAQSAYAVVLDWSHMMAMSLWLGGLIPLLLVLREERRKRAEATTDYLGEDQLAWVALMRSVVRRFSTLALAAVGYLAATGLFAAFLHVRNPALLIPTLYGRSLIVKLALFAALVGFGAIHRRVSIPHFERRSRPSRSSLERILPFETGVGCALLAAVALMASLGTSVAVWPAHQALGLISQSKAEQMVVTFRAVPGRTGENAIALDLADRRPGQATVPQQVTIDLGDHTYTLSPAEKLIPGTTQRFVSTDLVDMPEGKTVVGYKVIRPTYPDARGALTIQLPAALAPSEL